MTASGYVDNEKYRISKDISNLKGLSDETRYSFQSSMEYICKPLIGLGGYDILLNEGLSENCLITFAVFQHSENSWSFTGCSPRSINKDDICNYSVDRGDSLISYDNTNIDVNFVELFHNLIYTD